MIQKHPFSSKQLPDGQKLFRRKRGYTVSLAASSTTTYTVTVPYNWAKINEAEILWAPEGVKVSMKVKDSTTGTYSTIPNLTLNQFGFDINVATNYFQDMSAYDADVYVGMQLEFEFINTSDVAKTIGINVVFHEVV